MTDAGFFRGTSADQDNRFANKQKKRLKEINFSPILNTKLTMAKIDVESLKPWIEEKIKTILEKDDELLSESIYEHLAEKEPDGKNILVLITGFVDDSKASKFMEELWTKLIDLQENSNGISKTAEDNPPDSELKSKDNNGEEATKSDKLNEGNTNSNEDDHTNKDSQDRPRSSGSSHSVTPPSRSISKSPGNRKLDELSRGRPRKRLQDDVSRDGSDPPEERRRRSRSHSGSQSHSRSRSASKTRRTPTKTGAGDEVARRRSRSSSRSKRSGSRSRSRSYSRSRSGSSSRSRSVSRSRSRTRSPRHRSRSPYNRSHRGRRSRSRSGGYRPRSPRSPRGRRGFIGGRGSYRGSYGGFHNRGRGGMSQGFRRRSPWGRRRFSPRSPVRRRRSPSLSPRRRRSPSPYSRRHSRSRSPPGHHVMSRNIPSPRPHLSGGGHMDMLGGRRVPHHDLQRPMVPLTRSPRGHLDHRGYGDGPMLPRNSPGPIMNKLPDLPTTSHAPISSQTGPAGLYSPPSSGRKKHKKEKKEKHRKHKKSKKHRSPSPEKRKKHKKHKKTKKHKSH